MRALLTVTAALAALHAGQAVAQDAVAQTPVAAPAAEAEDVLTWDELPADLRRRAEPLIGRVAAQAVLNVQGAVEADADFRSIDHGHVLFEQAVRPAALARITRSVDNAAKYGPVGAALWPGIGPAGDYWCWRRFNPENAFSRGNIYCYEDKDGDGTSERMMENPAWMAQLPASRFQFLSLGHDEGVEENATFQVEPGTLGEFNEIVVLRYYGATRGLLQPDGSLAPATVEFELLTGPDRQSLGEVSRIRVQLNAAGKGEYHALNGVRLEVDGVNVDGTARVKLLGGLPEGRTLLIPPLTRELIVERMSEVFNPDGSPKEQPPASEDEATPAPAAAPAA
ncbi:hypothetical protein GGQ87_000267 [Brevundimonas alba]|uniref:Uncharacterized protein n=1 Tax=Brevundimonas alba TaxID=74314 RepID=A0A7X6BMI3_9CAUL|nr:hypothetical protein [Brevundimonas alba]NJC40009.1 hypothetical protein [Brevundimonas alba]